MFTEDWGLVSKEISKTVCYYVTVSIVTLGFSSRCDSKKRRKFLYETAGRATARETLGIDPGPSRPREVERGDGSLAAFLARVSFALFFFVFFFRALLLCPVEHLSTILLTLPRRNPQRKRLFFSLDSFPRMFDRLIATSPRSLSFSARSSREKLERVSPRSSVNFIEDQRFKDRKKKERSEVETRRNLEAKGIRSGLLRILALVISTADGRMLIEICPAGWRVACRANCRSRWTRRKLSSTSSWNVTRRRRWSIDPARKDGVRTHDGGVTRRGSTYSGLDLRRGKIPDTMSCECPLERRENP